MEAKPFTASRKVPSTEKIQGVSVRFTGGHKGALTPEILCYLAKGRKPPQRLVGNRARWRQVQAVHALLRSPVGS